MGGEVKRQLSTWENYHW